MRLSTRFLSAAILLVLAVAGCDDSRESLEYARQRIRDLTAERDGLKTQLSQASMRVAHVQERVAELETAAADASRAAAALAKAPRRGAAKATRAGNTGSSRGRRR
jgi:hypothetical protein